MAIDPIFETVFKRLYGKPCWGVENTIGTALTFEFGEPHLRVYEPRPSARNRPKRVTQALARRLVIVQGQWHLMIWVCDWEIHHEGRRLGSQRATANMDRLGRILDGQKLIRFSINARGTRCRFEFDLGGALVTSRPVPGHDHWMSFDPRKHVLTLHGDGRFSYQRSDQPCGAGVMKPVAPRKR